MLRFIDPDKGLAGEHTSQNLHKVNTNTHTHIPGVLGRAVGYGDPPVVRNTEVVLGLAQLSLQTVHTGDGQHELGGVRPHLPREKEEWRGEGEKEGIKQSKM
jgi:hypothetical protein